MTRSIANRRRTRRRGLAPLEVVMATAIGIPFLAFLLAAAIFLCRAVYSVIGVGVGSPLL